MLGSPSIGHRLTRNIAAHTWLCDQRTHAPMIPFIGTDRFTVVFPDFRATIDGAGHCSGIETPACTAALVTACVAE